MVKYLPAALLLLSSLVACGGTSEVIDYPSTRGLEILEAPPLPDEPELEEDVTYEDDDRYPVPIHHKVCRNKECFVQLCIEELIGIQEQASWIMTYVDPDGTVTYVYAVACHLVDSTLH